MARCCGEGALKSRPASGVLGCDIARAYLNVRLIREFSSLCGSRPAFVKRSRASLYRGLSGNMRPGTAAAVCASLTIPRLAPTGSFRPKPGPLAIQPFAAAL